MSTREKTLIAVVGAMLAVVVGYFGVQRMLLGRAAELDGTRAKLHNDLMALTRENARTAQAVTSLPVLAAATYDSDDYRASARVAASLLALVERAGLSPDKMSLQPVSGAQSHGVYRELGRTISVHGKLQHVVDFLYLLEKEPHLHKLDSISVTPLPRTNEVALQVRYLTLVMDAKGGEKFLTDQMPTTTPTDLESPDRKVYNAIVSRDLFRPYIQRQAVAVTPEPVAAAPVERTPSAVPTPAPAPSSSRFRLVGLPDWNTRNEVLVSDRSTGQLRTYKAGDTLAGGTIAMVDYRPLPSPLNPQILSPSRAIVKVGPDYWAIELGQDLAQKRRMTRDQLPEPLREAPQTAPADMVKKNAPVER